MLVLDNCEHVIDAAARMAEALLRANPAARAIATSREPRLYDVSGSTAASSTSRQTRIIRDAADDISQPGEWIDAVQFRGRDERINRGRAITSTIRTSEESGLPPNRHSGSILPISASTLRSITAGMRFTAVRCVGSTPNGDLKERSSSSRLNPARRSSSPRGCLILWFARR
jgi:hypothetical protein